VCFGGAVPQMGPGAPKAHDWFDFLSDASSLFTEGSR
jgi:hypothetical protein